MSFAVSNRLPLAALLSLVLVSSSQAGDVDDRFNAIMNAPEYKHAHWGLLAADLETGKVVYEHNADKLFVPASTTKLYTTASALNYLGADHRFKTPVYRRGELKDGVLHGDLVLVASGDLTLGGRTDSSGRIAFFDSDHTYASNGGKAALTEPDPLNGLKELAWKTVASGIRDVRGNVLVDDRLFDHSESSGSGPRNVTPILVNDNVIDLLITPGKRGEPARVTWRPKCRALEVDAQVDTSAAKERSRVQVSSVAPNRIVVRGTIPEDRQPLVLVSEVAEPAAFARSLFIEALTQAGVKVAASPLAGNAIDDLPPQSELAKLPQAAELVSPPFAENLRLILKVSHNLHASTLPLLVAAKHGQRSLSGGLQRQHDFLTKAGIDADAISFGGGAGGSRSDYTTPAVTVQLLRYMATRSDFDVYRQSLPILGVDGTSATHVPKDSPVRGNVQAKTGTLYWENLMNDSTLMTSKALAGYMTTAGGRKLAFAFFVNHAHMKNSDDTSKAGQTLGKLCEIGYGSW